MMLRTGELAFLTTCYGELRRSTRGVAPDEVMTSFGYEHREDAERLAAYLTWESLNLINTGCSDLVGQPQTALARMSIEAANREDLLPPLDDFYPGDILPEEEGWFEMPIDAIGCFESETRFAHSIYKQHDNERESSPACILFGSDGQPIAYQKGNGKPTALTWREGYILTADGSKWVPKGTLIRPIYEEGYDPRTMDVDAGLLMLERPHIQVAHFLRFIAASWLPKGIAKKALRQASERVEHGVSEKDIELGAKLSAKRLRQSVTPLLDKAYRI